MSKFAEEFFLRVANKYNDMILLKKGEFHSLIATYEEKFDQEVQDKLDLLLDLFSK